MADLKSARDRTPRGSRRVDPAKKDEQAGQRSPWRVEGERTPDGPQRPASMFGRRFWVVLLVLLVANYLISSLLMQPPERTEVPYTLFRTQVSASNVPSVNAVGDQIDGTFTKAVRFPEGADGTDVKDFTTHRPAFADNDGLFELLTSKDVQVTAAPPTGPSLLTQVLLGFGPTLLLIGLFILIFRRAAASAGGGIGGLGRSKAVKYEPEKGQRTTFADVAGIDEVEEELDEIVDFLREPGVLLAARRARSPRACCCRARRAPARRCWPGPWPARPTCRSSRSRPRSSSR